MKLEDDFDDLLKGASSDIQDAYKSELEQQDLVDSGLDVEDERLILADYNSDENKDDTDDEQNDEAPNHCTKVCVPIPQNRHQFLISNINLYQFLDRFTQNKFMILSYYISSKPCLCGIYCFHVVLVSVILSVYPLHFDFCFLSC